MSSPEEPPISMSSDSPQDESVKEECLQIPSFSRHRNQYKKSHNLAHLIQGREIQDVDRDSFCRRIQVTIDKINRLGIVKELDGHIGCVNCIQFNQDGRLLISGSDDKNIVLWDVHKQKQLKTITTEHCRNIFSVQFLPQSGDRIIISGAGDSTINVKDIDSERTTLVYKDHSKRVKRIATDQSLPHLFFSAAEDGKIGAFDVREPAFTTNNRMLIDVCHYSGSSLECKCVTINPFQPHYLAVGVNDPYVRIYDRRMIKHNESKHKSRESEVRWEENSNGDRVPTSNFNSISPDCVQYFVPGHMPEKMKYRYSVICPLSTTYLSYSQDGRYLLANLGGEHIYLYNTHDKVSPQKYISPSNKNKSTPGECSYCSSQNGKHQSTDKYHNGHCSSIPKPTEIKKNTTLPQKVEEIKVQANTAFKNKEYFKAIQLYNDALYMYPNSPVLYSNRAAALLKRNWDGDSYSALQDCFSALKLDPKFLKAQFRMIKCLLQLKRHQEAKNCHVDFCKNEMELKSKICKESHALGKEISRIDITQEIREHEKYLEELSILPREKKSRNKAKDYDKSFCGHCNVTTDIKEAIFWGRDEQFIAAGSDDGNLFIWNRKTTNLLRVLQGDETIVNCVQPHPTSCLLATSGIENVVKLWAPTANEGEQVNSIYDISTSNQNAMASNPLEIMLMQMGNVANIGGVIGNPFFLSVEDSD